MNVFGVTGWKNSGKTDLVVRLVAYFAGSGLRVATVKHAHHNFDTDKPGTDSYRHREAGAQQVLVASRNRWAHVHELACEAEPTLDELLARLTETDLVIVEGYKTDHHPKLQVVRPAETSEPMPEHVDNLVALASDAKLDADDFGRDCVVLDLNDTVAVGQFILDHLGLALPDKL